MNIGGDNIVNNSGGGNNNNLQVKIGNISKSCLVFRNDYNWLKDFRKGHVTKVIHPEGKSLTKVNTFTGKFDLYRNFK